MTTNIATESVSLDEFDVQDKADGPVAAAIIAGGVAVLALGIFTILSEVSSSFHDFASLNEGPGTLSGKAVFTVGTWLVVWAVMHVAMRNKSFDALKATVISSVLVVIGVLATIPPIFTAFAPAE